MNSNDLQREQAEQILRSLTPSGRYLAQLKARMEKRAFPEDDQLYRLVSDAEAAIHRLRVELHYVSCRSGVGRKPK